MRIQHWAIIFIIIMLPLSIVCRNVISKKNLNLRDETRYNNIVDNASYDAVSQLLEAAEELGYGKNLPITKNMAMAAIDRFFNTLNVNFNLPTNDETGQNYFNQYIPAIIIVGYDGIYVYSCEETTTGYEFKLKPKIPYSYVYEDGEDKILINFTLDNYVTLYFPNDNDVFLKGIPDEDGDIDGTHKLSGYIGEFLDIDQNGVDDLNDYLDPATLLLVASGDTQYTENDDPYGFDSYTDSTQLTEYIMSQIPMFTDNLSYILENLAQKGSGVTSNRVKKLSFLYDDSAISPNQDFVYDDDRNVIKDPSKFHELRRNTIINLITQVMKEEFNEHNTYAKALGVTYDFNIPDIGRDQWNNTIDDISVLAFFQGMPMGGDIYYNNYSLGGARIVKANYLYAETVTDGNGETHDVYHRYYCPLIPKDDNGNPIYSDNTGNTFDSRRQNGTINRLPDNSIRKTTGIKNIFVNVDKARKGGYYICSECM